MTNTHPSRRRVIGSAAALPAIALAACGAGQSSAPPIATIAPRNVTVSFAPGSWGTRAGRKEATDGMLKEFGAKLPHIKVDVQLEAPSPTPNQTWITRVVSGDIPDLVISSGALFEWMAKRNVWGDMKVSLQKI